MGSNPLTTSKFPAIDACPECHQDELHEQHAIGEEYGFVVCLNCGCVTTINDVRRIRVRVRTDERDHYHDAPFG
jgi:transcription initiation factor TFIIIB Brf1 subunit/transcription initiation factor TFIIB